MVASFDQFLEPSTCAWAASPRVEDFPEARKPAWKLFIDFGPELGEQRSSAQITNYAREELEGRLVVAVVNFPPRQIGPFLSEVLVLGAPDEEGRVILLRPDSDVPLGGRVFTERQATGVSPITFSRRSRHFIAKARVSSGEMSPNSSVSPSTYHFGVSTPSAAGPHSTSVRWMASRVARVLLRHVAQEAGAEGHVAVLVAGDVVEALDEARAACPAPRCTR